MHIHILYIYLLGCSILYQAGQLSQPIFNISLIRIIKIKTKKYTLDEKFEFLQSIMKKGG